jgi:hypothetical protein
MGEALTHYLNIIRDNLRLDFSVEKEVMTELESHIEDEIEELRDSGLSEEEAVNTCVRLLGSAKLVARQIYEAHSQGSWQHALLASLPHLLFSLIFALKWWQDISWIPIMIVLVLITVVYGWYKGNPTWLFPWLGYSLLPVVAAGLLLLYLPRGWSWLAIVIYVPLASWLLCSITVQSIKKDWLYSSLMLLPVAIIVGWFLAAGWESQFPQFTLDRLYEFSPWIGLSFLIMAASMAMFVRLRQRWLKVSVLFITGILTLTLVTYYASGRLGIFAFLLPIIAISGLFLTPALIERKLRRSKRSSEA